MTDFYEAFRIINLFLPHIVAFILCWQTFSRFGLWFVEPAQRPWMRKLLVTEVITLVLLGMQALQYEESHSRPGPISPVITLVSLYVLSVVLDWPKRRRPRHAQ